MLLNPTEETPHTHLVWTITGNCIDPTNVDPEAITLEDAAHALSLICRYNGNIKEFLSVGEHSLHVEAYLASKGHSPRIRFLGLIHDLVEYICGDITRPIKRLLPEFKILENTIADQVFLGLGILFPTEEEMELIHEADNAVMRAERLQLQHPNALVHVTDAPDIKIECWPPKVAREPFIKKFYELKTLLDE